MSKEMLKNLIELVPESGIESGAHVKDVQVRLGHSNIQTTLQTYVHDTEAMAEQSVDLFEKITNCKTS